MEPVLNTEPSGNEPGATPVATPRAAPRAAALRRTPTRIARAPVPAPAATQVPTEVERATVVEQAPLPEAIAPVPEPIEVVPPPAEPAPTQRIAILPWILAGIGALLVIGAIVALLRRRRRNAIVYETQAAPLLPVEPAPLVGAPIRVAPEAATMAAATTAEGRPQIELSMNAVRAGVSDDDARVEFELTVDNIGSEAARDVRISTWMFPAGSRQGTDMERTLIDRPADATLSRVDAGDAQRIDTAVELPTSGIAQDSVLPVVVAEARYRLADGSEERTSAQFAVGVPIDDELAHFDVENPSGLHDNVEARPIKEFEPA
jgi:hypothetical protein